MASVKENLLLLKYRQELNFMFAKPNGIYRLTKLGKETKRVTRDGSLD
jgi:hypothetical protein